MVPGGYCTTTGWGCDYRCSVGGVKRCLWEPIYGGHNYLRISKDIKHNLVHSVKTNDNRGSRFPGTLCEEQKVGQGKRAHRRIAPSQGPIVFYIRTVRFCHIKADKEGHGCQGVGSIIRTT